MASSDSLKSVSGALERGAGVLVAGRYRLASKIGSGGMGSVWLAHDLSLDATCAVKLIDDDKAGDEEIRMRFAREAKASAQLRSAHVVDVFDYGEWDGTHYIAMEYMDGEDLASRLERRGRLEPDMTYRIVAHVARALVSAHAMGIVHRDLKPENIFLIQSYDEEIAKVLDFGIAQNNAYSLQDRATREGTFLGTPCYVSPEQARGRPIDYRSDLWSLGVIAFQCLTGQLPFDSRALGELMGLILYEPIPKPSMFNAELPEGVDEWWLRAAARDRDQRFQSAKEMADSLGVVLGVRTTVHVPTVPPRRHGSIPFLNENSGLITSPKARIEAQLESITEPRAAQSSIVHVAVVEPARAAAAEARAADNVAAAETRMADDLAAVETRVADNVAAAETRVADAVAAAETRMADFWVAAEARAADDTVPREDRRVSATQLTRPAFDRRRFRRVLDLRPKSNWLALALPIVALLVVISVALGFWLRGPSVATVQAPAGTISPRIQMNARKDSPPPVSKPEKPDNTMTVDMLPLVTPPTSHAGGVSTESAKPGTETLKPDAPHKLESGQKRPSSPPRPSKSARDYGI